MTDEEFVIMVKKRSDFVEVSNSDVSYFDYPCFLDD